jgi:hypothetical protein
MSEKLAEKKEDFNTALILVENILDGSDKIDRFKFTTKEKSALLFVIDLLNAHIKELDRY